MSVDKSFTLSTSCISVCLTLYIFVGYIYQRSKQKCSLNSVNFSDNFQKNSAILWQEERMNNHIQALQHDEDQAWNLQQ